MKIVYSWLQDYIDLSGYSLVELARILTMTGLEVEEVQVIGLPMPANGPLEFKFTGLSWDPEKIIVARIDEVMPHPNADRLVLCRLNDGQEEHIVLTGAPNLYEYKGIGPLPTPLKVAWAKEGAQIYDGHQPGQVLTTLKRAKIRGVESYSMVCSEKELGISDEHEGIMILDPEAPTGAPLRDVLGDAVFEISILPNMIRNASVIGVARELSAVLNRPLRMPDTSFEAAGPAIDGMVSIQIVDPDLNPRFMVGLIQNTRPVPSPDKIQRRLTLAGMRPINSLVDATNYVMLETGEPLHAFDYDKLVERAGGKAPTIITRAAKTGEKLTTLDEVERELDPVMILVTDTAGPLSLAGVMGGLESEVTPETRNVLLEAASWNFVNVRRTMNQLRLNSEAGYRFSRGVHPELAPLALQLGLKRMQAWSGAGEIARGVVDNYPRPHVDPVVTLTPAEVARQLGVELPAEQIAGLLRSLDFEVSVEGGRLQVKAPPHRLDIGEGIVGKADLIEEIARLYGYDNIPETRLSDELPPARANRALEVEERIKELLAGMGLQEVITYRLTTPEREARLRLAEEGPLEYIRLANPISPERVVMRRSLLASVMEVMERNARVTDRLALFEAGPVYLPVSGQDLPVEAETLAIAMCGRRYPEDWNQPVDARMDFFDLKGLLEALLEDLHIENVEFTPAADPTYHPGKCARLSAGDVVLGTFGELHPEIQRRYDLPSAPVLAAELDLSRLIELVPERFETRPVPVYPAVLEDLALVVDEDLPAAELERAIRQAGGPLLADVRLFDIYRGEQIGAGKKSMAYSLAYQAPDHTLNEKEAAQIRQRIIKRLEHTLGAKLRG